MDLKSKFREEIKAKIRSYSQDTLKSKSESIFLSLKKLLEPFSGLWAAFQPLKSEPQIDFNLVNMNIKWAFPVTNGNSLLFRKNVQQWSRSSLGVLEPLDGDAVTIAQIEGFIVPCLGLNSNGHRLGRGAGFYDRTFDSAVPDLQNKYKIGLCFEDAIIENIPHQNHDLLLDVGISEKEIYFYNNNIKKVFT